MFRRVRGQKMLKIERLELSRCARAQHRSAQAVQEEPEPQPALRARGRASAIGHSSGGSRVLALQLVKQRVDVERIVGCRHAAVGGRAAPRESSTALPLRDRPHGRLRTLARRASRPSPRYARPPAARRPPRHRNKRSCEQARPPVARLRAHRHRARPSDRTRILLSRVRSAIGAGAESDVSVTGG